MANQQQAIHKFVIGNKEFEGKTAEFQYDRGWYSITDIMGEDREIIYKSKNAQEAYMKWNVYIGRKKERPIIDDRSRNGNDKITTDKNNSENEKQKEYREHNSQNSSIDRQKYRNRRNENAKSDSSFGREERRDRRRKRADRRRRDREAIEE